MMNYMELSLSDVGHKLFFRLVAPKGAGCLAGVLFIAAPA